MNAKVKEQEYPERPWPAGVADSKPDNPADSPPRENGREKVREENPAAASIRLVPALIGELKSYALHFASAKIDGLKVTGRKIAIYAALGVVGLLVGAGVLVTAVAMLVVGIAHAIGALLGDRPWLGEIIISSLILGTVVLVVYLALSKFFKASRVKTEQKYEGKRIQQRVQHGRDVTERAAQNTGKAGQKQ